MKKTLTNLVLKMCFSPLSKFRIKLCYFLEKNFKKLSLWRSTLGKHKIFI